MERYTVITEDLECATERQVVKRNQVPMVAVGLVLLAVLSALGAFSITEPDSSLSTLLWTAAVIMALAGVVKFFTGRRCFFYQPTGSRIKPVTLYFDNKESGRLRDCMEEKRFEALKGLKRQINSGVKVDAMVAADSRFVAVQLSEYVPYTYEPVSPVMCYYDEDARVLSDFLKSSR